MSNFAETVKNYLEYQCVNTLRTELEYGKEILLRTGKDIQCPFCFEIVAPALRVSPQQGEAEILILSFIKGERACWLLEST